VSGGAPCQTRSGAQTIFGVLVLGLGALRSSAGLSVAPAILRVDVPVLLAVSVAIVLLFGQRSPHYRTGVSLLITYFNYVPCTEPA
jgi:Ca2+/Na+ antiporter